MTLDELRARLDVIDDELIDVLARRAKLVDEIWAWKEANGAGRFDAEREAALRERLLQRAEAAGLSREAIAAVLSQIVGKRLASPSRSP